MTDTEMLLRVEGLKVAIRRARREYICVDGVSLKVAAGGTLGLVGESGSGKSVTCLSILRLNAPNIRVIGGSIIFDGQDITSISDREYRGLRGRGISMVYQDGGSGLNPLMRVGKQIEEALLRVPNSRRAKGAGQGGFGNSRLVRGGTGNDVKALLERVRIADSGRCARSYPHELSGGQRQRVMIAMAIAASPKLLVADEPTTALDAATKYEILDLLREIGRETGIALILISHDIGIIREMCSDVNVMYMGQIVERGKTGDVLNRPLHPYTKGLVRSAAVNSLRGRELYTIGGAVTPLEQRDRHIGCVFAERCEARCELCRERPPEVYVDGRMYKCVLRNLET